MGARGAAFSHAPVHDSQLSGQQARVVQLLQHMPACLTQPPPLLSPEQDVILRGGKALPLYTRVVEAGAPHAIVLPAAEDGRLQVQLRPGDVSWRDCLGAVPPPQTVQAHVAAADDPAIVLFSSGTTGTLLPQLRRGSPIALVDRAVLRASLGLLSGGCRPFSRRMPQASPRPSPGRTPRRCDVRQTPFSTRMCGEEM